MTLSNVFSSQKSKRTKENGKWNLCLSNLSFSLRQVYIYCSGFFNSAAIDEILFLDLIKNIIHQIAEKLFKWLIYHWIILHISYLFIWKHLVNHKNVSSFRIMINIKKISISFSILGRFCLIIIRMAQNLLNGWNRIVYFSDLISKPNQMSSLSLFIVKIWQENTCITRWMTP